ncbi:sensor histidine kinase [Cryptosporangium sp. NPDC051539]|uniref:sensor histidine kinase n=1 Tax=Cryptosporangium sp. NPDC051539 TaxID=3363962 RepID=UPI0037B101AB
MRGHPALKAVLTGLLAGLLAYAFGHPYWTGHQFSGVLVALECAVTAGAGMVLRTSSASASSGDLITLAGFAWALNWSSGWDAGWFPLIADFAQASFFLLLSVGVLLYPTGQLQTRAERLWVPAAVVVLGGGELVFTLLSRPEWIGYRPDVVWPTFLADRAAFDVAKNVIAVAYVVLAAGFAGVLILRARRTTRGPQRVIIPALVGVAAMGVVAALVELDAAVNDTQTAVLAGILQGTATLIIPFALLGVGVYRQWLVAQVAHRLVRLTRPASVAQVRAALRTVLEDPTLDLLLWAPGPQRWVDAEGRVRVPSLTGAPPRPSGDDRWLVPVTSASGRPLAVVDAHPTQRLHEPLVRAAIIAGTPALETAQLQAVVQAQLEQTRVAQAATLVAEARARRQMERDLHDGVQTGLSALAMQLAAAQAISGDDALQTCRDLLDTVLGDLRMFVRGINPAVLESDGLGGALRAVAERFPGLVDVEADDVRYRPQVEQALFFTLNEALANAVRHAGASRIVVRVGAESAWLTGSVSDDGSGTAQWSPTGGLAGIRDRIELVGGLVELDSTPRSGTRVCVRVPLEMAAAQ